MRKGSCPHTCEATKPSSHCTKLPWMATAGAGSSGFSSPQAGGGCIEDTGYPGKSSVTYSSSGSQCKPLGTLGMAKMCVPRAQMPAVFLLLIIATILFYCWYWFLLNIKPVDTEQARTK